MLTMACNYCLTLSSAFGGKRCNTDCSVTKEKKTLKFITVPLWGAVSIIGRCGLEQEYGSCLSWQLLHGISWMTSRGLPAGQTGPGKSARSHPRQENSEVA